MADKTDKRTRELTSGRKVPEGEELARAQAVQNHLQTIQSERSSGLAMEKATVGQEAQTNELLAQAGAMAAMGGGGSGEIQQATVDPQTQAILGKYGLGKPRIQRTQSRNVQVRPANITINNTTNTTTTNNVNAGLLQGRPVTIKSPGGGGDNGMARFKAWLGNVFSQQREVSAKRVREFEKRDSSLSRQAGKMLKKLEEMGKTISGTFNPKNIGTTIGNQLRVLLFLFGATFLATHWKKVLKGIDWVGEKVTGFLDYLGITTKGKNLIKSGGKCLRNDFIRFFLGDKADVRNTSIMDVFKTVLRDTMDYFKMKLDHAMEERGAAIKSIKFPELNWSDPSKFFGDVLGYLGNILTAIVDPKKAVSGSVAANIKTIGAGSSLHAMSRSGESSMYDSLNDNTSAGDYALARKGENGKQKYSLLEDALDISGNLRATTAASISQGRDILGAINDARDYGKLDVARISSGLDRLEKSSIATGGVTVDREFLERLYGGHANQLITNGSIIPTKYKYVLVEKSEAEKGKEGAGDFWSSAVTNYAIDEGVDAVGNVAGGYLGKVAAKGAIATGINEAYVNQRKKNKKGFWTNAGAALTKGVGDIVGVTGTLSGINALDAAGKGLTAKANQWLQNDYTVKLVPVEDPRPSYDGRVYEYYKLTKGAVQQLANLLTGKKSFNYADDPEVAKQLNNVLINAGGGQAAIDKKWNLKGQSYYGKDVQQRDMDLDKSFEEVRRFNDLRTQHEAIQKDFYYNSSLGHTEQSIRGTINSGYQFAGSLIRGAGEILGRTTEKSNKITNEQQKKHAVYIMKNLTQRGLQPHQAAGIVGNLKAESGLNPSSTAMDTNHKMAGGLAAWNGPLWEKLHRDARAAGKQWNDLDFQLDFLWNLLNNGSKQMNEVKARLANARTPYEASDAWAYYERYAGYNYDPRTARQAGWSAARIQQEHDTRGKNANGVMDLWKQVGGQVGSMDNYLADVPSSGYSSVPDISSTLQPSSIKARPSAQITYTTDYIVSPTASNLMSGGSVQISETTSISRDDFGIRNQYSLGADSEKAVNGFVALVGDSYAVGMAPHFVKAVEAKGGRAKATCWNGKGNKAEYYCASGATVNDALFNVTGALEDGATVIVLHVGLNSSAKPENQLVGELTELGQRSASGGAKVFFVAPITNQPGKFNSGSNAGNAEKVARSIRQACTRGAFGLIDLSASSAKYKNFDNEGIHPTGSGYSMMAKDVVELLFSGGGKATATAIQEEGQDQTQGIVDNSGFDISTISYSTPAESSLANRLIDYGSVIENSQLVSQMTSDQYDRVQQGTALRAEAANIWGMADATGTSLFGRDGKKFESAEEFIEAYSTIMSDYSRKNMKRQVEGSSEAVNMWELLGDKAEGSLGMTKSEFRKYYRELDDRGRENVRGRIDLMSRGMDNYENWKAQFSKEELKKIASEVGASNIHGGVADDTLRGVYASVLNGNFQKRGNLTEAQKNFAASILQGDEFANLSEKIQELTGQLSMTNNYQDQESLRHQIGILKSQRSSLGKDNFLAKTGDRLDVVGEIDKKNKGINDINKKIAEIEYNKANFDRYFNENTKGLEHLSDQALLEMYDMMWEELCQEQEKASKHLAEVTGMSEKEIEKYRADVQKAAEIRTKHERFTKTSLADLQKEFDKLSNNGQNYLEGVKAMFDRYGEDAVKMLGLTLSDLQEGYLRTKDLMFDQLSSFEQMADIQKDYELGKIDKEEYNRLMTKAKEKGKQENIERFDKAFKPSFEFDAAHGRTVWGEQNIAMDNALRVKHQHQKNQEAGIGKAQSETPVMLQKPNENESPRMSWGSFDIGGYTGPGPMNQVVGIVHSGELVETPEDIAKNILNYGPGSIADTAIRSIKRGADPVKTAPILAKLSQFSELGRQVALGKTDSEGTLDSGTYFNGVRAITEALGSVGQVLHSDNEAIVQVSANSSSPQMPNIPKAQTRVSRMTK